MRRETTHKSFGTDIEITDNGVDIHIEHLQTFHRKTFVFVYGTLLSGFSNYFSHFENTTHAAYIGKATLDCAKMYNVAHGRFPGVVLCNDVSSKVVGEVWAVSRKVLIDLDYLEGYNESAPRDKQKMYDKVQISVTLTHNYMPCVCVMYEWVKPVREDSLVPNGDWRKFYNSLVTKNDRVREYKNPDDDPFDEDESDDDYELEESDDDQT